jgi:hypothetical protein
MSHRFVLVFTGMLAISLAGCGSSAASPSPSSPILGAPTSPTTQATPAPSPSSTATAQANPSNPPNPAATSQESAAPSDTLAIPSFVLPSFTSDKELEGMLPDAYKGVTLTKQSFSGSDLLKDSSASTKPLADLHTGLGKSPSDLSFAFASDVSGKLGVTFGAYRIKGVDASVWLPLLLAASIQQTPGTTTTQVNIGGRDVTRIQAAEGSQGSYVYPRGDVLFFVSSEDETLIGDALAALP